MPKRLPKTIGSVSRKVGRPTITKEIPVILYNDWYVEYDYFKLSKVYLISIYPPEESFIPPFHFARDRISVRGRGVEKYIIGVIEQIEKVLRRRRSKMSRFFKIGLDEITLEQLAYFQELRNRGVIKI